MGIRLCAQGRTAYKNGYRKKCSSQEHRRVSVIFNIFFYLCSITAIALRATKRFV